jgi:hypothetical protein
MASQERDRASANLLRHSLSDSAGACPEPEILAAYFERSLDADETRRYELHFSQCARCREQLAAMHRAGEPAPAGAAQSHTHSHWAWLWDWRFLAPAVAMLVIAAVWMAHQSTSKPVAENSAQSLVAMSRPSEPPAAPLPPPAPAPEQYSGSVSRIPNKALTAPNKSVDKAMKQSSASIESQATSDEKELASNQPMIARQQAELDQLKKDNISPKRDLADTTSGAAAGVPSSRMSAPAAPAAAPPPSPAPEPSRVNGGAIGGAISSNEIVASASEVTKAKPSASPTFVRPMTGQEQRQAIAQSEALTIGDVERHSTGTIIKTPNPKVMWRIAEVGFVERTINGGTSWQGQQPDPNAQLIAGSAPSAKVCWFVGIDGVILLTRDAQHWKRIPPPVPGDFAGIEALDDSSATVTTADGRKFATADAGGHWKLVP